jgi:diguanylate cyclase (GGDEF)-like protein
MTKLPALILDKVNVGIIVIDEFQSIIVWNDWLEKYSGKTKLEVSGRQLSEVCPRFSLNVYQQMLQSTLMGGQSRFCSGALHPFFIAPFEGIRDKHVQQNMQVEPILLDGECYALIQISDVSNQYSRVKQLHNVIKELETENEQAKRSEQILQHKVMYDSLTGLTNRALFNDRLIHTIQHAERDNLMFAVLFLDLDGFKQVNDTLGHLAGDELLKAVSERMKKCIRKTDTLARLGGDEFTILLSPIKQRKDATVAADKLLQSLQPLFEYNRKSISITVSIGIAIFPSDSANADNLLKAADEAMYAAKSLGKNTFCFYGGRQ